MRLLLSVVYWSSPSGNTEKLVNKLGIPSVVKITEGLEIEQDYVLIVPTYANADGSNAVAKPIKKFLASEKNRAHIKGVISGGNTNFGEFYGLAADEISFKCACPVLYKFELAGTPEDVNNIIKILEKEGNKNDNSGH